MKTETGIEIEIGKLYITRDGDIGEAIEYSEGYYKLMIVTSDVYSPLPFWYHENGVLNIKDNRFKLVREVTSEEYPEYFI